MKEQTKIREYNEELPVYIIMDESKNRLTVEASNEGGYNTVNIDLLDIIDWVRKNMPELIS